MMFMPVNAQELCVTNAFAFMRAYMYTISTIVNGGSKNGVAYADFGEIEAIRKKSA